MQARVFTNDGRVYLCRALRRDQAAGVVVATACRLEKDLVRQREVGPMVEYVWPVGSVRKIVREDKP